ncbi:TylF/MycF/NovP-related O-methyltransferase [Calderihabitans maritimus]|uniref:O-methyltransferase n=1 Tax=Calderihabitans maritimus TaxID=1246530 RepID=A0A1Z5HXC2_9FIRM|nr:TylF/MycF/NovP-related O-methyltransferase [Calderihabitans maritimus]GAW94068.1 O-methyltransferase [Calderihabitans maritimus]
MASINDIQTGLVPIVVRLKRIAISIIQNFLEKKGYVITSSMLGLGRERRFNLITMDYIRLSTLELIAHEIYSNKVEGSVAELGVYRGDFAQHINALFKDRKLYLFDTFSGFDNRNMQTELDNKFSDPRKQDFSDTNVQMVLRKMQYPENCVIKQGFFPETAIGLDDVFAFVSIDADLYEPIYDGLKYFYPRLNKGGYILVHDYNNTNYLGAKEAVKRFCKEKDIGYVPLSDAWGSAVISK